MVHQAVNKDPESAAQGKPIGPDKQTDAAREIGERNFSELQGRSEQGGSVMKFSLAMGRIFQLLAKDPIGHAPEINQFEIKPSLSSGSNEHEQQVTRMLDQGVMHLAFVRMMGSKLISEYDTKAYDYMLHPIFSPFFCYSHRRKRKMSLGMEQVTRLMNCDKQTISDILKEHNRTDDARKDEPEQLNIFKHLL